jgi:hypothetical protein
VDLRLVGAGLPRPGTQPLKVAFEHLLDGRCYHMSVILNHPFDLAGGWERALAGDAPEWDRLLAGYVATLDRPASMFWRELSEATPDALVLLSVCDDARTWLRSAEQTILPVDRRALAADWDGGRGPVDLLERFAGSERWDPTTLEADYVRHNAGVRETVPRGRLLERRPEEGWDPIRCSLGLPVPELPFPSTNRSNDLVS